MTVSHRPPANIAAILRLPPPTIQNELELYEEMRTRRIEVRGTGAPNVERTQRMEMPVAPSPGTPSPADPGTQRLDALGDTALDPSTHGST